MSLTVFVGVVMVTFGSVYRVAVLNGEPVTGWTLPAKPAESSVEGQKMNNLLLKVGRVLSVSVGEQDDAVAFPVGEDSFIAINTGKQRDAMEARKGYLCFAVETLKKIADRAAQTPLAVTTNQQGLVETIKEVGMQGHTLWDRAWLKNN